MNRIAFSLLLLPLAACSILSPKPDRTRNYLLTEQVSSDTPRRPMLVLAVGPIDFPAYLDRAEMATRNSPNRIQYSELDRWAEPLSVNFVRVFTANLGNAVGTENVVRFPMLAETAVDYRVKVDVDQLESRDDGMAVLVARWELTRGLRGDTVRRVRSVKELPIDGTSTADSVEALSRVTAMLAEEIAAAIAGAEPES